MCPHCQEMKPIYIEAAKQLSSDPDGSYILGEVNTMIHERLGKHFQIKGLPTILIFSPLFDHNPMMFNKNRTVFDIVTEIELLSGLITVELKHYGDFLDRFSKRTENILLGIFKDETSNLYEEMKAVKNDFTYLRIYYSFNIDEFKTMLGIR